MSTAPTTGALERQENGDTAGQAAGLARAGAVGALSDPMTLGKVLADSGFFRDARQASQAVVKVLAGQELGLGPIAAMTGIHIIEGKPTLGANLLAGLVKRSPRYDYRVTEWNADRCVISFFEDGQHVGDSDFSMEDARSARLTEKDNWKKYPRNMLFARALSNGVTLFCPDIAGGSPIYTPEELGAEVNAAGEPARIQDPPPPAVASRAQATAKEPKPTEPLITVAQRRKLWKEAETAGIKDQEKLLRAIIFWVAGAEHSDRIPRAKVDAVLAAVRDHEGSLATIIDQANEGDERAKQVVERFLEENKSEDAGADGGPGPEPGNGGPAQGELA